MTNLWQALKPNPRNLRAWQVALLVMVFAVSAPLACATTSASLMPRLSRTLPIRSAWAAKE